MSIGVGFTYVHSHKWVCMRCERLSYTVLLKKNRNTHGVTFIQKKNFRDDGCCMGRAPCLLRCGLQCYKIVDVLVVLCVNFPSGYPIWNGKKAYYDPTTNDVTS